MTVRPSILATVNSPGEVATWLRPVVTALRRQGGDGFHLTVLITPCVYASGTEERVVRRIPGVDAVLTPRESFRFALFGKRPPQFAPGPAGALLHLGGEFALTARMARRLQYRAFAYSEGYINHAPSFDTVFTPYPANARRLIDRGCKSDQVEVVGNLMVDAAKLGNEQADGVNPSLSPAQLKKDLGIDSHHHVVALFPGSRPHEIRRVVPLLLEAAAMIEKDLRDVRFVFSISPFVDEDIVAAAQKTAPSRPEHIVTWRGRSTALMGISDLALTIPGSTTAELATWGVPTVVCLPLDRPAEIPLDGLAGYVDRIPLVGKRLKAAAVLKVAKKTRFVALPNRIAGEALMPELKSESLQPRDVAQLATEMLRDEARRKRLSERLTEVMGDSGAADAISSRLLRSLQADMVVAAGVSP